MPREHRRRRFSPASDPSAGDDWWRTGVVYQIYPRSFADSDGDGVGDLAGITARLDYLAGRPDSLGVDAIWLSPIYPSPGRDLGYDVSDHEAVDPLFGSMADLDRLVAEAHKRGLRVMLDLVLNHTSEQHPWFRSSRAAREGPFADRYLWRDHAGFDRSGRPLPPNNWVSFFGGPGWTWEPRRGQFYQHIFLPEQPDLNWRDPGTAADQWRMVRGWLDRGIDGFRLDTFNNLLKHPDMPSNPIRRGRSPWDRQHHVYEKDQPDLPGLLAQFRSIVDARPGRMSVGEPFDGNLELAAKLWAPRHLVFDFELLSQPWSAAAFVRAIDRREAVFGRHRWPTVVFGNHDRPRLVSRWAEAGPRDDIARCAACLLLTLRGTPFVYYGDELGMPGISVPDETAFDPPARRNGPGFRWWNRDQARAPMPWTGEPGGGFSIGSPWLPLPPDADSRNAAAQVADPRSVLSTYRELLALRRATPALQRGTFRRLAASAPGVLAYVRSHDQDAFLIVANLGRRPAATTMAPAGAGVTWQPVISTSASLPASTPDGGRVRLQPLEAVIFEAR